MTETELITDLQAFVKERIESDLRQQLLSEVVSVDWMEAYAQRVVKALAGAVFEAWKVVLEVLAKELALPCPGCGRPRKCKHRPGQEMKVSLLGLEVEVPKLYLECGHCDAPGVSITKVLTGLSHGDASLELKLAAAYAGAEHSYGKASRDLQVHHGQQVERTKVRRMSLEVEELAKAFAEELRNEALQRISGEAKTKGVERLMQQGDGGSVRCGRIEECEPGDEGYGKTTPKTNKPVRKRITEKREIITLDVREPGQLEPQSLDVVVPCEAEPGQRSKRMLAAAARAGLGDNTEMLGLGDLGSQLPEAFDEALVGYNHLYSADWKHVRNYVEGAAKVLEEASGGSRKEFKVDHWQKEMLAAIWHRDLKQRDALLDEASAHRVKGLPEGLNECPVHALGRYLKNNWPRMHAAYLKRLGVDYVSARAEANVRDYTKGRFVVPGAWLQVNLEGKAILRAIIGEGSYEKFCRWCRRRSMSQFERQLQDRLEQAVRDGRLSRDPVAQVTGASMNESTKKAA
jgi:hypothetical protein